MLKGKYRNSSRTLIELQGNIWRENEAIRTDVLETAFRNTEMRIQSCLYANSDHLKESLMNILSKH